MDLKKKSSSSTSRKRVIDMTVGQFIERAQGYRDYERMCRMKDERHETIEDIVAEMINEGHTGDAPCLEWVGAKIRGYADRIEEAAKREREATREKSSRVGNAAKMREALERIRKELIYDSCRRTITKFHDIVCEVSYSALSAPPRNCDVGTAEEQAERFHSFCESNKQCGDVYSCECCQLNSIEDCELAWSQMPYEEGAEDGK